MSNESLALSDTSTAPPNEADGWTRHLAEIAAAIERIERELEGTVAAADGLEALESIRDVAFTLHERSIEATLCDQLDAAIRDASAAFDHAEAVTARLRQTAGMLRTMQSRIGEMLARSAAERPGALTMHGDAPNGPAVTTDGLEEFSVDMAEGERASAADLLPALELPTTDQTIRSIPRAGADAGDHESAKLTPSFELLLRAEGGKGAFNQDTSPTPRIEADSQWPSQAAVESNSPQSHTEASQSPAIPNVTAADPLACVRALREEELIALFS